MTVDYKEYRRKRLLWEMKTCKAYMLKVSKGLYELNKNPEDYRIAKLDADADLLGEWIEEEQRKQDMGE